MMGRSAFALFCALLLAARAAAYTVDCNHEYTDCDTELSKLNGEEEESISPKNSGSSEPVIARPSTTTLMPTRSSSTTEATTEVPVEDATTEDIDVLKTIKPRPRLLNMHVDELQTIANALHNQTGQADKKPLTDLSDVNLDDDEEDELKLKTDSKQKQMSDKFYSNLQAPFHMLDRISEEADVCKENEITYKAGERIERGCEETCECSAGGVFECSPRCKHPYIRRGRRLTDPLCFESPVDECCSIVACATGNGDIKPTTLETCRYGNDTYTVGSQWNIGCEQTCTCEKNSVVTCKPRCERHLPSDKCINVQDPNDACCEVQVCDVSQDVHEEQENATSSTTSTTEAPKSEEDIMPEKRKPNRPLVLAEPIGSVKVLQNNTVQVNLIHTNSSEDPIHLLLSDNNGQSFKDIELKYSNLILNLEGGKNYVLKTKETGTKFNFTITASDTGSNEVPNENVANTTKVGCYQDGVFYAVGEEFHIGCTELCECTGPDSHECAALVCPSHVGLELMSKGCVRWAPNPPPQPPNCCPRAARCLSDGTCHYKGVPIPNWSEVPIELTGCEQRCFCENGDLECQETCSPLSPVPPQTLRCPPMHRPAPVNISDDDCCKQWGCLPNAGDLNKMTYETYLKPTISNYSLIKYVTPNPATFVTPRLIYPSPTMEQKLQKIFQDYHKYLNPKTISKYNKSPPATFNDIPNYTLDMPNDNFSDNMTAFSLEDEALPIQKIHTQNAMFSDSNNRNSNNMQHQAQNNFVLSPKDRMHDIIEHLYIRPSAKPLNEPLIKVPMSKEGHSVYFVPLRDSKMSPVLYKKLDIVSTPSPMVTPNILFQPAEQNYTIDYVPTHGQHFTQPAFANGGKNQQNKLTTQHVTTLRFKDLKPLKLTEDNVLWNTPSNKHLLTKEPNPYATVLMRPILKSTFNEAKVPQVNEKMYSALDLERILSQMEVESEVNRNLGRSADMKIAGSVAGQSPTPDYPTTAPEHPKTPPFLPTISPEIHFPQEVIPDYDQNNIHRPVNPVSGLPPGLPPGLHVPPSYGDDNKKLSVLSLIADSPSSVMMLFGLPPVLVGLRGSVDLRYTDQAEDDVSRWYSQVFAPEDEVLTTPRLEFRLTGLKPSTTYKVRGKLFLHNLPVEPESEVYTVRTLDLPTVPPVEEKRKEIDSQLTVVDVNDTVAHVSWRHFNEDELQFIDGIQVRYRPVGTPIFSMTELLHHSRSAAELHDLRVGVRYEASLVLVPPPKATTELQDPGKVEFTTLPYVDPYNWTVTIEARTVGSEAAEVTWRGVPSPAERWVRVYRAAHACGPQSSRREHDAFRLAARDLPPAVTLTGLDPDTRCRVWLELFLTNGKVKTSNVLEIHTKSLDSPDPIDNEIEAASSSIAGSRGNVRGDYYGALVIVGVIAALGALTSLLLLLVVVRRHRPRSVPITSVPSAPRESSLPPYDNPAYKLELQQETMDL